MHNLITSGSVLLAALFTFVACGSDDSPSGSGAGGSGAGGSGAGGSGTGGSVGSGGGSAGQGGETSCESPDLENDLEIAGAYRDSFDGLHRVDDTTWLQSDSPFSIVEYDNDERWVVARNADDADFNPGLYSRFDWTVDGEALYYCQPVFDAETAEDARDGTASDADDLESGCGGFEWSQLSAIEIQGSYEDSFGGSHEVTPAQWTSGTSHFHLLELSNEEAWVVAQNDCDNPYNPGLYSRFDWFVAEAGGGEGGGAGAGASQSTYYCQTGYAEESVEDAKDLEPADPADLETGCNGFYWSELLAP